MRCRHVILRWPALKQVSCALRCWPALRTRPAGQPQLPLGRPPQRRLRSRRMPAPANRLRHAALRSVQVLESVASVGLDAERYNRERDAGWTHVAVTPTTVLPLEKHDPGAAGQLPKNWMPVVAA